MHRSPRYWFCQLFVVLALMGMFGCQDPCETEEVEAPPAAVSVSSSWFGDLVNWVVDLFTFVSDEECPGDDDSSPSGSTPEPTATPTPTPPALLTGDDGAGTGVSLAVSLYGDDLLVGGINRVALILDAGELVGTTPINQEEYAWFEGCVNTGASASGTWGDVNDDALEDILIQCTYDSTLYIFLAPIASGSHSLADAPIQIQFGGNDYHFTAWEVGDVTGDELVDLVVPSPEWASGGIPRLTVISGPITAGDYNVFDYPSLWGERGTWLGQSLQLAELSGDGVLDIVAGAPSYADYIGDRVYVVYGGAALVEADVDIIDTFAYAWLKDDGRGFGRTIQYGCDQLIIGAPHDTEDHGSIYLYEVSIDALPGLVGQLTALDITNNLGVSLAVNEDCELLVGATNWDGEGAAFYIPTLPQGEYDLSTESGYFGPADFGRAVALLPTAEGTSAAVGSPGEIVWTDDGGLYGAGVVYIYPE